MFNFQVVLSVALLPAQVSSARRGCHARETVVQRDSIMPNRHWEPADASRFTFHVSRIPPPTAGPSISTHAYGQAAGTRAWNCRGRLSNPSTIVLARTNRRLPTGTAPNSAESATGAEQVPMMR